ncbi:MAG TPA: hypothetical protein VFA87_04780 [Rhizomicrobium sp.]|nr:hypothetical protein [Rhizomicrobium sp.]
MRTSILALALTAISVCAGHAAEPSAILEIGGASETGLSGGTGFGPSLAVEATPIEDLLEIEAGIAPLFSHGQTEWDTDFLFKRPYTLSDRAEFMLGIGPTWSHSLHGGQTTDTFGASLALDFMFWPWKKRDVGWYVEPGYGFNFAHGHEQSLSMSIGLLIPIP